MNGHFNKGSGSVTAVIIILLVLIVGFLAYHEGLFRGHDEADDKGGINIDLGGGSRGSDSY